MKFYAFTQNNSGGRFQVTDTVCNRMLIEARDMREAYDKAQSLGVYFDGVEKGIDCRCCGDRWGSTWEVHLPRMVGKIRCETVEEYAQALADSWEWTAPDARIFYADGSVAEIFSERVK